MTSSQPVVLVVEDEPLLLMMATDIVEDAGFQVIEARNADEAMKVLEGRNDIAVLFTDIDMPRGSINGLELAKIVRDRWANTGILLVSGHVRIVQADLPDRSIFISKPYDQNQVAEHLHRMTA